MSPSVTVVLDVCERMLGQLPVHQALIVLAALSDEAWDRLAALSVGERDGRLLELHARLFGPALEGVAACPGCGGLVDLGFDLTELTVALGRGPGPGSEFAVEADGHLVRFRLPDSLDLLAVADQREERPARRALLGRCVLDATREAEPVPADRLPDTVVTAVSAAMAAADPGADVRLGLRCPTCDHDWEAAFDVLAFLVDELSAWSARTLEDVHELAVAYGWTEPEILAMSGWRRRRYLELVGA
jgi:hypothetical protein